MRKIISLVLFGVGGFLLVTAVLLMVWVPGKVKVTPLDTDSDTRLVGEAKYQDQPRGRVEALSWNRANPGRSNDDTIVFNVFTCLYKDADNKRNKCPDPKGSAADKKAVLSTDTDVFASDRKTAEAVGNHPDLPKGAVPHKGVVNKWPFDAEKKTYKYWDPVLKEPVDAKYTGEETIEGLKTQKYKVSIKDRPATVTTIGDDEVKGTYSSDKTMWVDPVTGAIQKQHEHQVRKLENGKNAIDLDFQFTPETIKKNVADARDNGDKLSMVSKAPWVVIPLAIIAIIVGLLLWRSAGSKRDAAEEENDDDLLDDVRPRGRRTTD